MTAAVNGKRGQVVGQRSVARQTARRMMRETVRRGLVPGDRVASEPVLLNYFEVSRGSLREALRILSFLGAIRIRSGPGGGSWIAMPRPRVVGSALAMALQFRGATLRTLLEAREAMEPTMAELAAARRKDQDIAALDAAGSTLVGAVGTDSFQRESNHVHHVIAQAAGNEVLALLIPALTWMSSAIDWSHDTTAQQRLADQLSSVVDAVRSRDTNSARERMAGILRYALGDLEQHQPAQLAQRVIWPDVDELLDADDERGQHEWVP